MSQFSEAAVSQFCNALMRSVVATGVVTSANADRAVDVLRAEAKAFFFGGEYADARDCLLRRAISQESALALLVASCALKIKGA